MTRIHLATTVRFTVDPVLRGLDAVLLELERAWKPEIEAGQEYHAWVSLPLHAFLPALKAAWDAVGPARPVRFLDVGAGIGTKLLLVRGIYREEVRCQGIDLRPEYCHVAFRHGLAVEQADAAEWDGYGAADIVYVYRPAVDAGLEARIKERAMAGMRPGAVLILACGETVPAWQVIPEGSAVPWVGVWRKP